MRKKVSRIEEENESLVMQLKKMAMKKGNSSIDKDEGISGDMDDLTLSELKLQLELNEQVNRKILFGLFEIINTIQDVGNGCSKAENGRHGGRK